MRHTQVGEVMRVSEARQLMKRRGVERLPVTDEEERLIGIVTRRDLLRVLLCPDAENRRHVSEDVLSDSLGVPTGQVDIHVLDGVVTLQGPLERQSQIPSPCDSPHNWTAPCP